MPRDSTGTYSLPTGTLVNTGDTVQVSQHNPAMQDIAQALTGSLDRDGSSAMRAELPMGGNKITGLADGTNPTDAATVGQLQTGAGVPVGAVIDYWGSTAPSGFMFAYGQAISRTTYAELFAVMGTSAGAGDGTTTFNLPDYRAVTSVGKANMGGTLRSLLSDFAASTLGSVFGAQSIALTSSQMPVHTHTVSGSTNSAGAHSHSVNAGGNATAGGTGELFSGVDGGTTGSAGTHSHTISVSADNAGGGASHPNVQPSIVCNKIIRVSN